MEPIKPEDIKIQLSDKAIEIVNQFIQNNWNGEFSSFRINEIKKALEEKSPEDSHKINNIIPLYTNYGWIVEIESAFYEYLFFKKKKEEKKKTLVATCLKALRSIIK